MQRTPVHFISICQQTTHTGSQSCTITDYDFIYQQSKVKAIEIILDDDNDDDDDDNDYDNDSGGGGGDDDAHHHTKCLGYKFFNLMTICHYKQC